MSHTIECPNPADFRTILKLTLLQSDATYCYYYYLLFLEFCSTILIAIILCLAMFSHCLQLPSDVLHGLASLFYYHKVILCSLRFPGLGFSHFFFLQSLTLKCKYKSPPQKVRVARCKPSKKSDYIRKKRKTPHV